MDLTEKAELTREGILERGTFIQRYAGIEFAMAHLLAVASMHPAYAQFGPLAYSVKGKLKQFKAVISSAGPLLQHSAQLEAMHDEFASIDEYRHFLVHGVMVGTVEDGRPVYAYRLYVHEGREAMSGSLSLTPDQMGRLNASIQPLCVAFTALVNRAVREMMADGGYPVAPAGGTLVG